MSVCRMTCSTCPSVLSTHLPGRSTYLPGLRDHIHHLGALPCTIALAASSSASDSTKSFVSPFRVSVQSTVGSNRRQSHPFANSHRQCTLGTPVPPPRPSDSTPGLLLISIELLEPSTRSGGAFDPFDTTFGSLACSLEPCSSSRAYCLLPLE
ncbi:hypothetical protein SCLCIDRAFT_409112 [Scleroderma citrinum Foug A]|uniref:Uncharacterized protein n=1 Tax=Scleroderma citrinum Foug A TaxID=1036808 RepID=A0A0C2YW48_9AGAM|nr:hypothetical protein SCLCIDRAFT_409112 [Scleroderma citrinum Foug A]